MVDFPSGRRVTLTRQDLRGFAETVTQQKSHLWRSRMIALSALCSWIGYSLFLSMLCILTYTFLGEVYEIFITSTMFYLLSLAVKHADKIKKLTKIWKRNG